MSQNHSYTFHVINAASNYGYLLSVEGHKLIISATDGQPIVPVVVDVLMIYPGERYDLSLKKRSNYMVSLVQIKIV